MFYEDFRVNVYVKFAATPRLAVACKENLLVSGGS